MNKRLLLILTLLSAVLYSCNFSGFESQETSANTKVTNQPEAVISKGDLIISKAIKAHGGDLYDQAHYSFDFRTSTIRFIIMALLLPIRYNTKLERAMPLRIYLPMAFLQDL